VPVSAVVTNEQPSSAAQRKKLDVLVGQLRDAGHLTTEQLWNAVARTHEFSEDGELHWSPLRDSLSKAEASSLIERLERYAATKAAEATV
jgi:hypothetical protein